VHKWMAKRQPAPRIVAQPDPGTSAPSRPRLAIEVVGLRKSFGDLVALDGLDLAVAEGTVVALVGPNGSGKTTTVRILSTLLPPDAGTVSVAGHHLSRDPELVRSVIGVTGQFSAVDNLLTGRENLALMADLHHLGRQTGHDRAIALLERFELADAADRTAVTYSGGMRRRLDLAMTLMGDPRIIFLDEPTTGLDPRSRRVLWHIVREVVAGGVTILLTTQYLEEADELADQVAVLDHGLLVAHGSPGELKRRVPGGCIRLDFAEESTLTTAARLFDTATRTKDALSLQLATDGSVHAVRVVLDRLERYAVDVEGLSVQPPSLDDVFFALTGHARPGDDRDAGGERR
jgi:ABC-2 type transport system ATP-binding protein